MIIKKNLCCCCCCFCIGISAVINTSGAVSRGRIEHQDSMHWETMFKTNVLGSLRTARAFIGLLRPTHGRLIYFGACNPGDGLVAFTASRIAVEGCVDALRTELQSYGINVIALDSRGVSAEALYRAPIPFSEYFFGIVSFVFPLIFWPILQMLVDSSNFGQFLQLLGRFSHYPFCLALPIGFGHFPA